MIRESEPIEVGPEEETSIIARCENCGYRMVYRPTTIPKCDSCGFVADINAKSSGSEMICND